MAQIREFESTTESYFILDGVSYPKVYEAMLDNGYSDTKIKLVGTNRDTTPLVFSTEYTNIRVDGDSFDTALEAISRLNQIVFSKGGGSGTGGATNVITEDSDTVAFTGNGTAGNPLSAKGYNGSYSTTEALTGGTWDGLPIYRKIVSIRISPDFPILEDYINLETFFPGIVDVVHSSFITDREDFGGAISYTNSVDGLFNWEMSKIFGEPMKLTGRKYDGTFMDLNDMYGVTITLAYTKTI